MSDEIKKRNSFSISPDGKVEITIYLIDGEDDGAIARGLGAMEMFKDNIKTWAQQQIMKQMAHKQKFGIISPNGKN